jgi:hypothetical protein
MTMYELDRIVQLFVLDSPFHGLMSQFYKEKPRDFRKLIVNHARVSNKFPRFFIFFIGALISLSATADLVANVPIDRLENSQRRLIASTTASFVCTKAAQTWYYLKFRGTICEPHCVRPLCCNFLCYN